MMTKTKTTIDHTTFTVTFQRLLSVPREEVFDAWTDPDQIKQWWDPTGAPLADCAVDLRPGGAFVSRTSRLTRHRSPAPTSPWSDPQSWSSTRWARSAPSASNPMLGPRA